MTVTQSRELRRARKRRALLLLSGARQPEPLDDESLERMRQAWREWGGQTHTLLDPPFVRR